MKNKEEFLFYSGYLEIHSTSKGVALSNDFEYENIIDELETEEVNEFFLKTITNITSPNLVISAYSKTVSDFSKNVEIDLTTTELPIELKNQLQRVKSQKLEDEQILTRKEINQKNSQLTQTYSSQIYKSEDNSSYNPEKIPQIPLFQTIGTNFEPELVDYNGQIVVLGNQNIDLAKMVENNFSEKSKLIEKNPRNRYTNAFGCS